MDNANDGKRWVGMGAAVIAVMGALGAGMAEGADIDGVTRMVVEAEDMAGVDQEHFGGTAATWRVGRAGIDHYQNNTFGGHWQSRTRTAMTDAGASSAPITATVQVPKAGKYKLWVKYECPPNFNYPFQVACDDAAGKRLFAKTYGLIEAPKHFSFTDKLTTGSLYWNWGIDHDAAEGYEVDFPQGQVKITLDRAGNPAGETPAAARSIDAILITDDLAPISSPRYNRYPLLDELRRNNRVFVRIRVDEKAAGPVKIEWDRWGKRYADFYTVQGEYRKLVRFYDAQGELIKNDKGEPLEDLYGQWNEPVAPGGMTPWIGVGPGLNVESAATFFCKATGADKKPAAAPLTLEVALEPSAGAIVKAFTQAGDENQLIVLLQPDLRNAEGLAYSRKLIDAYREVTAELEKEGRRPYAPIPKKMRFFGGTGGPTLDWQTLDGPEFEAGMRLRQALGLNTVAWSDAKVLARTKAWNDAHGVPLLQSMYWHHTQDPELLAKGVREAGVGQDFYYVSYGDEIGLPAIDVNDAALVGAFREYLQQRKITPEQLGLASWEAVKPLAALSTEVAVKIGVLPEGSSGAAVDAALKKLYWHSVNFRIERGVEKFRGVTAKIQEMLGSHVQTTANLGGMHPFYWVHQASFIEAFKHQAMTLAWSEDYDYTQPETMRLCVEFLAGYMKAGTKYHGQRMMFYCMPHYPGQSPEHLIQNAVMLWSQNVKDLDWFGCPPDGFSTENYVNGRGGLPTFRAMKRINEMAGALEDVLEPAQPVGAAVALLLSEASDTWEIGGKGQWAVTLDSVETNAFQEERKNLYYALRLAGYRVDLITELDVQDGYLERYKALYVGGENMERATAGKVAEWVRGGGVVYVSAAGARKDEYDQPLETLNAVVGRGRVLEYQRYRGALRSKIELPFLQPLDRVTVKAGEGKFDALATRERFEMGAGAELLATYADGTPAAVRVKVGSGTGYYVGTMVGEAWAKAAIPKLPAGRGGPEASFTQMVPVNYDAVAAAVITQPLRDANIVSDLSSSTPMLALNRLRGPEAEVITVVNLGHNQQGTKENVKIQVADIGSATKVYSFEHPAGLAHEVTGNALTITLPKLSLADIIVIKTK